MENDLTDEDSVRQLSDLQEKVLAILPLPSAVISVFGSSIILYIALESRNRKQWTPYTRLLVGMSLCDILYSISISISSFLRPRDTSAFAYAMGTGASCNASGFLNQLSMSAIFFNAALSFYFLATARYGVSTKQFSRRIEPIMYLICIGHPILTAAVGSYAGLFAERRGIMGCWLEFDKRCVSEDPEIKAMANNCTYAYTGVIFYVFPAGGTLVSLLVNNLIISRFVSRSVKATSPRQRTLPERTPSIASMTSGTDMILETSRRSDGMSMANTLRTEVLTPHRNPNSDLLAIQKAQHRRLKLVKSQAFLFVASYFICHLWSVVMATADFLARSKEAELEMMVAVYPIALIQAIFQPAQGMLNMLVFVRPKYLKWRNEYPWETKWWALQRSIFGERIRPTMERPVLKPREEEDEEQSRHFAIVESKDEEKEEAVSDGDGSHTSGTSSAYSRATRENMSTLTASVGDFDHVIQDGVQDERWTSERADNLTSWVPNRRSAQSTSRGTRGSSLEVISENAESVFEAFPTSTSITNSVTSAKKLQEATALKESPFGPEEREGRWSPSVSPSNSPSGRIRKGVLQSRVQASDTADQSLKTTDSPTSRWSAGSIESPKQLAAAGSIPLPKRVESETSSPPPTGSPISLESSGHSVSSSSSSSAASLDSPLVPPRRRLSPPPFARSEEDGDSSCDSVEG